MKITRIDIARYEDGHPTGSYMIWIPDTDPDAKEKEKFWGYIPVEWFHAIKDFEFR